MLSPLLWVIIGMAIVTYVPRMIPLTIFDVSNVHPKIKAILKNVPFAILGALIIPGIFTIHENIWFGVLGGLTAVIVALLGANLIIVVLCSIAVLMVYSLF